MILGFLLILAIIFFKYEPVYEIKIAGNKIGYTKCENEFKDLIEDKMKKIKKVTKKMVVELACKIEIDTIYLLKGGITNEEDTTN